MELECFLCKRKIDVEREQPFVFECYVYCEKRALIAMVNILPISAVALDIYYLVYRRSIILPQ